ncbi:long-chain fatty acid--CoA ligase [Diaminobutyricibacter tongyongensis]|uniref:Long-chain fatty acid--CoA ligase n=1 Tax=Leifsonia tongyongensis TaxID=1268043 RepID=A0A6L9XWV1_9MICO|nr:fatty acid--CoA ligase family protein [Diaminobutyricibacter tongyongensis]NEN05756.1 long-chain fatty acid--CoA ligase [Diaminobutyricibacter tongyongensis]
MTRTGSIARGAVTLDRTAFDVAVAERSNELGDRSGRIVAIRTPDGLQAVVDAFAVRASGGVPVVADDRWEDEQWLDLQRTCEDLAAPAGVAWATLTSGSTRAPRLVLRSDASWSASYETIAALVGLSTESIHYVPVQLVSSMAMFSIAMARHLGHAVRLPRQRQPSSDDLADATHVHATPRLFERILDLIEEGAPHRLGAALIGGAALDPSLRHRAEALGIRVVTYYGAAELSFVAVDVDGAGMRVLPEVDARIDDGRLWVRSPYLAAGYAGDERGPLTVDTNGWATVGDLAAIGADGRLTVHGRSDGAILTAAATVVPEEVEAALRAVPGVREAVVFGTVARGEDALVTAVVELDPGIRVTAPQLRERMRSALTLPHRPRLWYAMDRIPLTATGKPARGRVREAVANGEVRRLGQ